jgi:DNA-binding transcriptional MerR regulator
MAMTVMSAQELPQGERYTIDELARLAGMTVRNIRAHQSSGLLPPPELRGRTGYYGSEHLDRLQLIQDMQADGFNLEAIRRLVSAMPAGVVSEVLGFERALKAPWGQEQPEIIEARELLARFRGVDPDPQHLVRAEKLGLLRRLEDGRIELLSPTLVHAAAALHKLGIPLSACHDVQEEMNRHSRALARTFVKLFLEEIWQPFDEAGHPEQDWERIHHALEVMRPLALEGLVATFRMTMTAAVDEARARVLREQARRARRS